jgi:hypothetical protein
VESIDSKGGHA